MSKNRNGNINITGAGAASVISSIVTPFYAGIFLDNDAKHRNDVSVACFGKITAPIVPEGEMVDISGESNKPPTVSIVPEGLMLDISGADGRQVKQPPRVHVESKEYMEFIEKLSLETDTSAATIFPELRRMYNGGYETYDAKSGINQDIVTEIQNWVIKEEHKGKKLVAIFDFDRTLTVMEGGFFFKNSIKELRDSLAKIFKENPILWQDSRISTSPLNRLTAKTFAEYLAGGTERMKMLQKMFDFLYDNKVSIVLLTNNRACPTKKNLFDELTKVYTKGRPFQILCGADFGNNKGDAILATESLKGMCSNPKTTAGGRRRKTKKAQKKQKHRKTRRR